MPAKVAVPKIWYEGPMPRPAAPTAESPPAKAAPDRERVLAAAAGLFRREGLAAVPLARVAKAAGVTEAALVRQFPTPDELALEVFADVIQRLKRADAEPWTGYGAGMRRSLAALRPAPDGFILLAREGPRRPRYASALEALRRRTGQRLTSLLWYPDRPPPAAERPALLGLALEPMISFCTDALAWQLEHGDAAGDDLYARWAGQMMRDWRHNAAELLNLDTPEQDWPFDANAR